MQEAARDKVLGTKRDFEIHRTQAVWRSVLGEHQWKPRFAEVLTKSVDHDRALKESRRYRSSLLRCMAHPGKERVLEQHSAIKWRREREAPKVKRLPSFLPSFLSCFL